MVSWVVLFVKKIPQSLLGGRRNSLGSSLWQRISGRLRVERSLLLILELFQLSLQLTVIQIVARSESRHINMRQKIFLGTNIASYTLKNLHELSALLSCDPWHVGMLEKNQSYNSVEVELVAQTEKATMIILINEK